MSYSQSKYAHGILFPNPWSVQPLTSLLPPPPPFPISLTRRQVSQVQPSDVTITSIRNNAQGQLEFVMYIRMAGGSQVLTAGVLEAAIEVWMCLHGVVLSKQFTCEGRCSCTVSSPGVPQSGTEDFTNAGFSVRVVPPPSGAILTA